MEEPRVEEPRKLSGSWFLGRVLVLSVLAVLVSCHGTCKHRAEEPVHHVYLKPERLTKRSSPEDLQLKIKIIYDHSVDRLPADKRRLVKEQLFPQAIDYLQRAFSVRRRVGPVLLSRQCSTNQYLRKRDDPHRYCQDACADVTRCGPVVVPQHHLQQCKVCSESGKSCGPLGPPDGPGVEGSDFVLYVSGVTTERCGQENIVAYAAYCQLEAELDRPIAGYANLCPTMISSQPQEFEGMLSTVKHEIIHALGVFKSWALFNQKRCPKANSLHWLLREPLVNGARLDVSNHTTHGLTAALIRSGTLTPQQLVDAAGPALTDTQALGSLLGLQSLRVARRILELWSSRLSKKEKDLLMGDRTRTSPDAADPYPDIILSPGLGEKTGPLLRVIHAEKLTITKADKETLYRNCVKCIHQAGLSGRPPTVWTKRWGQEGPGPQWRILYKAPLKKRTGDLQWRILHGADASNAFISVINPTVLSGCPFCGVRETIYHVFTECKRLTGLFSLLTSVFTRFNVVFTERIFILGAGYNKNFKIKWQLLNFLSAQAKLAIYTSRKRKVEQGVGQEAAAVWKTNLRSRLRLEFGFYRQVSDLESFKERWCFKNTLCEVLNDQLSFSHFLLD
ncbi:transposon TX1 uncharacterized 149 kDa protein isoform X2 [Cebidichthys violaceus]|uniref:transposon TX1 uncharacterized 149 kDa protein isoform X2 n=1 Tax=Cebidichthys violaceus TaxID=271503 RepID=UPI0035CB70B3